MLPGPCSKRSADDGKIASLVHDLTKWRSISKKATSFVSTAVITDGAMTGERVHYDGIKSGTGMTIIGTGTWRLLQRLQKILYLICLSFKKKKKNRR